LKAMERKANSPKKAEHQQQQKKSPQDSLKRPQDTSSAMQRLTLTADENTEDTSVYSAVYSSISLVNGKINRMDLSQLKALCEQNKLSPNGKESAIRRRLKEYLKTEKLIEAGLLDRKAAYQDLNTQFFIVIDFEATCEEKNPPDYPHEIIEFPAVLVSTEKQEIVDYFHSFVRPVINPTLSQFCRDLTGVEQKVVDDADPFPQVHDRFLKWMDKHGLGTRHSFTVVTDGPFDMGRFLCLQAKQVGMAYPVKYAAYWANLRKCFANFYKRAGECYTPIYGSTAVKLPGLQQMLDMLGMTFEGLPHSGLDDAKNIARILIKLLEDRAFVRVNERIVDIDGPDTDDRGGGRLSNVAPVTRLEAEELLRTIRKKLKAAGSSDDGPQCNSQETEDDPSEENLSAESSFSR